MGEKVDNSADRDARGSEPDSDEAAAAELTAFVVEQEALRIEQGFYSFLLPTDDDTRLVMMSRNAKEAIIFPGNASERVIDAWYRSRTPPPRLLLYFLLWIFGVSFFFIIRMMVEGEAETTETILYLGSMPVGIAVIGVIARVAHHLRFEPLFQRECRVNGIEAPFPPELGAILIDRRRRGLTAHQRSHRRTMFSLAAGGAAELATAIPISLLGLGPIGNVVASYGGKAASEVATAVVDRIKPEDEPLSAQSAPGSPVDTDRGR